MMIENERKRESLLITPVITKRPVKKKQSKSIGINNRLIYYYIIIYFLGLLYTRDSFLPDSAYCVPECFFFHITTGLRLR